MGFCVEMTSSPPTQKQIADRLGVSQALVSRALSGRAGEIGASERTVARIRKVAEEWNYQPSAAALALLGAPTRTVGVVVRDFDDPFFGRLIGCLQREARSAGLTLLLTGGDEDDLCGLRKHRVDAVLLAGSDFFPEGIRSFIDGRVRVAQIGGGAARRGVVQVRMDDEAGVGKIAEYLAGLGHRQIGFAGRTKKSNRRRGEALRKALRRLGLTAKSNHFLEVEGSPEDVAESAKWVMQGGGATPTAWIAAEDVVAVALLGVFHKAGLQVPGDISVAGIDDIPVSACTIPPLTTLHQPVEEMVRTVVAALMSDDAVKSVALPGSLVVRESCAPPACGPQRHTKERPA